MFSSVSPYGRKRSAAPCIHRRCRGDYPRQPKDVPYRQRFELNTTRQPRYLRLHNWPRNQRHTRSRSWSSVDNDVAFKLWFVVMRMDREVSETRLSSLNGMLEYSSNLRTPPPCGTAGQRFLQH